MGGFLKIFLVSFLDGVGRKMTALIFFWRNFYEMEIGLLCGSGQETQKK